LGIPTQFHIQLNMANTASRLLGQGGPGTHSIPLNDRDEFRHNTSRPQTHERNRSVSVSSTTALKHRGPQPLVADSQGHRRNSNNPFPSNQLTTQQHRQGLEDSPPEFLRPQAHPSQKTYGHTRPAKLIQPVISSSANQVESASGKRGPPTSHDPRSPKKPRSNVPTPRKRMNNSLWQTPMSMAGPSRDTQVQELIPETPIDASALSRKPNSFNVVGSPHAVSKRAKVVRTAKKLPDKRLGSGNGINRRTRCKRDCQYH
jgi:hypothetical protein